MKITDDAVLEESWKIQEKWMEFYQDCHNSETPEGVMDVQSSTCRRTPISKRSKKSFEQNACPENPETTLLEEIVGYREKGGEIARDGEERERGEGGSIRGGDWKEKKVCVCVCVCVPAELMPGVICCLDIYYLFCFNILHTTVA